MAKKNLIILIITVIVFAIGSIAFINLRQPDEIATPQQPEPILPMPSQEPITRPDELLPDIADKADLVFLIEAAKNCDKAVVIESSTIDLFGFGMLITTETLLFIRGMEEDKCVLYIRTKNQEISFSDEFLQKAIAEGATQEGIDQQLKESNKYADKVEGKDGICKFKNNDDLVSFLSRRKDGTFSGDISCSINLISGEWECTSTGDWAIPYECRGTMFNGQ